MSWSTISDSTNVESLTGLDRLNIHGDQIFSTIERTPLQAVSLHLEKPSSPTLLSSEGV